MSEILYENIDYGAYLLIYEDGYLSENVKYAGADFNKLYTRSVRLPDGTGNIIYLLSRSFERSIAMVKNHNFLIPSTYKKFFYPWASYGKFMNKRYSFNVVKLKQERNKLIKDELNLRTNTTRYLQKSLDNVFFSTGDIFDSIQSILSSLTIKKVYEEFYSEFIKLIDSMTPDIAKESKNKADNNRVIIIDADSFAFKNGGRIKDNINNPLFLLYMAYFKMKDLSKLNVDRDMMICSKNMFIKFNPKELNATNWDKFKRALFRIMNANLDNYIDNLSEEDKMEIDKTANDKLVSNIVADVVDPYTKMVSPTTGAVLKNAVERSLRKKVKEKSDLDKEIKKATPKTSSKPKEKENLFAKSLQDKIPSLINQNPVANPLDAKRSKLFSSIGSEYVPLGSASSILFNSDYSDDKPEDYDPEEDFDEEIPVGEFEDDIKNDVAEILSDGDEEVLSEVIDDIQDKVVPLNNQRNSPINSARDKKLREEQKKVMVMDSTVEDILNLDSSNVPIQVEDKSSVLHTSNKNMKEIKFANFDKTYIEELYTKDLVSCFDMLKDKGSPFYITSIEVKDTSDNMNLIETWTVHLTDENKKRHTIKVDIPKFQDNRFMWFEGTKWIILKQNFYNPLVKDTPDTVICTTNYNKITITRKATKSLGTVERIFSLIKKTGDTKMFTSGNSNLGNMKYISTLEYDEISRNLFKFSSGKCVLYFSRDYIKDNLSDLIPSDITNVEFYIGHEGSNPILINEDTGLDRSGRTISEIIEDNLPDEYKSIYSTTKSPSQSMYVEAKMAGEFIPIIVALIAWEGLTKILDRMKITWKFDNTARKVPKGDSSKKYIRFANGVLEYEAKTFAELILNGLSKLHPEKLRFEDFDTESAYAEYVYTQWGSYNGINEIMSFYEFLIDPITKDVCRDLKFPTDPSGLMIRAVQLLADNAYVSKASDKSYRVRSIEMIPSILYSCIADQYKKYVKSGRRLPMTLNQKCVIKKLIAEKTVEAYSTLNPVIEVGKNYTISTKGYKGSNSDHSYDESKRSYDPSSVGKLAISTSPDANVGINKIMVIEPTIINARGYREPVEDPETLKDVNVFSPVEMLTPGTPRNDDPIRTAISKTPLSL